MKPELNRIYFKYAATLLIILFAIAQYILILRHKSPYLSDSYFYKHIYYQMKGDDFESARQKIISEVDLSRADKITKNIFENKNAYLNSYTFFVKRPLYPAFACLLSFLVPGQYLNFLIPVFLGYLGIIVLVYFFSKEGLGYLFGTISTAFFISFYPFLDWSTYFLTDTLGAFFWLLQFFFIYRFIKVNDSKWLLFYAIFLSISLLNREQSVLMIPATLIFFILLSVFKFSIRVRKSALFIALVSFFVVLVYLSTSIILNQRTVLDAIVYTQNNYGLDQNSYTARETLTYLINTINVSHIAFFRELVTHHWWLMFVFLAALGIIKTIFLDSSKRLIDVLLLSSGTASYLSIFIYPVLSYRYFFPVLLTLIYFAAKFIEEYFKVTKELVRRE